MSGSRTHLTVELRQALLQSKRKREWEMHRYTHTLMRLKKVMQKLGVKHIIAGLLTVWRRGASESG